MIKIVSDTTACLPDFLRVQYKITVVPQMIHFGVDSYTEGVDIDINLFLELLKTSKYIPKTSAPPPELFSKINFRRVGLFKTWPASAYNRSRHR